MPNKIIKMWRDVNCFNQAGIPAIAYGTPVHYYSEARGSGELFTFNYLGTTASLYALIVMDICSQRKGKAR